MQIFRKITEALDTVDTPRGRGNAPIESALPTAQVVSSTLLPSSDGVRPADVSIHKELRSGPPVAPVVLDVLRPQATTTAREGSSLTPRPAVSSEVAKSSNPTKGAGYEWEVVPPAVTSTTPRVGTAVDVAAEGDSRPRATDAFAEEAARILRTAATAAEALAPRLSSTLRRAEAAEAEVLRMRTVLEIAEARIKEMEMKQEKLTEGFIKEIQQRDAEIATFKAAAASSEAKHAEREVEGNEAIEVFTFSGEGKLGIEFDQTNDCLKILSYVAPGSQAEGRLSVGDEVVSVSGVSARNLSWEEMLDVLSARPVVISVRRAEGSGAKPSNPVMRALQGWTRAFAARGATDTESPRQEALPLAEEGRAPEGDNLEDINRPFYELVRASISEAVQANSGTTSLSDEEQFERWLRQFHSERDDEWYVSNHVRLVNAFKPPWDEVVEAHRALAPSRTV